MSTLRRIRSITVGAALAGAALLAWPALAAAAPVETAGNPGCADIDTAEFPWAEEKIDAKPTSQTYDFGEYTVTITMTGDNTFDWSASTDIDAVIVKGGDNANVYTYSGTTTSDGGLTSPTNPKNGSPHDISHVSFCTGGDPTPDPEPDPEPTPTPTPDPQPQVQQQSTPAAEVLGVVIAKAPAVEAAAAEVAGVQLAATGLDQTQMFLIAGSALIAMGAALLAIGRRGRYATVTND